MAAAASSAASASPTSRRPQNTMSTNSIELVGGTHQFTIVRYSARKVMGVGKFIRSVVFEIGGYSWAIRCYPFGVSNEHDAYVSLYLELLSTARETVTVNYSFRINGPRGLFHLFSTSSDFTPGSQIYGCPEFLQIGSVEAQYLVQDCLTIRCTVEVHKESNTGAAFRHFIDVPPSSVCQDLARLLENKHGSDVTFQVGSNEYAAHRAVLAMRSPVFAAQFFGPMANNDVGGNRVVRIQEMEPAAFEAVLHFIYTDSLPPVNDCGDTLRSSSDWLAAADRFGLERMRLLCENLLCESIDVENIASTLLLADRHHCHQLKAFCVDYIASPGVLRAMKATVAEGELFLFSCRGHGGNCKRQLQGPQGTCYGVGSRDIAANKMDVRHVHYCRSCHPCWFG